MSGGRGASGPRVRRRGCFFANLDRRSRHIPINPKRSGKNIVRFRANNDHPHCGGITRWVDVRANISRDFDCHRNRGEADDVGGPGWDDAEDAIDREMRRIRRGPDFDDGEARTEFGGIGGGATRLLRPTPSGIWPKVSGLREPRQPVSKQEVVNRLPSASDLLATLQQSAQPGETEP